MHGGGAEVGEAEALLGGGRRPGRGRARRCTGIPGPGYVARTYLLMECTITDQRSDLSILHAWETPIARFFAASSARSIDGMRVSTLLLSKSTLPRRVPLG